MKIISKKINSLPALLSILALFLFVPGCVTLDQSEKLDTRRELNALNAMYKGVMKKMDRLDKNTNAMMEDIEQTTTGFASLEVETRSSLAESNAELERFREEFGFVRGGIEESTHINEEFKGEIESIKTSLDDIALRLARLENASKITGEEGEATSKEAGKIMASLNAKTGDIEAKLVNLTKLNTSLEKRISELEGKKSTGTKAAGKKTDKDPAELYKLGHQNALRKNYSKALKQLKEFLRAYPKHELADKAQYWLARSYYGNDDWERAVLEFNKVIKKYPKSDRLGPATYMQGLSFLRLGSEKEAKLIFERVIAKFPDSKEAGEAKKRLKKMELQ
jgi:tol-pal system protein YbgF